MGRCGRRTSPVKRWVRDNIEVPAQDMNRIGTEERRKAEKEARTVNGSSRGVERKNLDVFTCVEDGNEQDTSM